MHRKMNIAFATLTLSLPCTIARLSGIPAGTEGPHAPWNARSLEVSWHRFQKNGCKNMTSLQLGWQNMHRKAHTPPILEKGSVKHVQTTRCTQEPDRRWVELVEKSQGFRLGSRRIFELLGMVELYFFDAFGFGIEVQNLGSDQCRCLQSHWESDH